MKELTVDILKVAFRKLLTATYYDKTDMVMRRQVALFAKSVADADEEERRFGDLLKVVNGENPDLLDSWMKEISLTYYPKKVIGIDSENDPHVITNDPPKKMMVERLLVKADIPVELCILDVAWLLLYGYKADSLLSKNSYGNRLDLVANDSGVRMGNALFRKYQNQYKAWWENGIRAANKYLKEKEDISIINFDIINCYHSIDFNFDEFFAYYDEQWPDDGLREDPLTVVVVRTYERYWEVAHASGAKVFNDNNKVKHPMPLSLMSAHVFANWYLSPLDTYIKNRYQPIYYGRYVDDCMIVVKTKSKEGTLQECVAAELPGLIEFDGETLKFAVQELGYGQNRLAAFELQQNKLYVYRFDSLLPQTSLDEFAQGQMERSSEYRFLTDDADSGNVNLELVTLVNTLDAEEEPGRRFNILEENRYKLSVYLAKLSKRLAKYGQAYKHYDEVEKVYRFFKEGLLIKHYQLWERLLTVYVLAGRKDYVQDFCRNTVLQILSLDIKDDVFADKQEGKLNLIQSLQFHLEQSYIMALSLQREADNVDTLYLDAFMVRMHYNSLPLQEFAEQYAIQGVRMQMDNYTLRESLFSYRWMPYYVKYYAIVSALSLGNVYDPDVYRRAFGIYCMLNHVGNTFDWMAFCRPPQSRIDVVTEFNVDLAREPLYDDRRTVAVVEMDLDYDETLSLIDHYGAVDPDKIAVFDDILDQITKIYKTDIFILPELSLPIYELMGYCLYASKKEVAFVSGLEYVVKDGVAYNYIVTTLPITLYGQRDAVPVIRLKNHYAPKEADHIVNKKYVNIPKPAKVWQNLYHWHGHVFTSYYCFELASIFERSFFYQKIDAMYCPVFNPDTYYFNNIAESMARDMHCYFILCNVSHYGDSRVTKPDSHVTMNMLKVKGGNTSDNKAVVLSAELDVQALRAFQLLKPASQKTDVTKRFKQTPPDFDKKEVAKRGNRFIYKFKGFSEQFIANIAEVGMKY